MVPHQVSYESPVLFAIFLTYFKDTDFVKLEECALKAGATNEEWKNFIAYAGGFYANMSNYHNFGHMKFVPELASFERFELILRSHPEANKDGSLMHHVLEVLPLIDKEVMAYQKPYTQINFPDEGGVTGYFSRNMGKDDLKAVQDVLKAEKVDILNTRAFKQENGDIVITVGSIEEHSRQVTHQGRNFIFQYGEFRPFLEETNYYLEKALPYCANDTQKRMLELYIEHYKTGSIETHKDSQRQWIRDKGPVVETNMGWIETYLDPSNTRAYYEGWVSVVDKERSKKFNALVANSEAIIPLLPWPKEMEKDKFLAPDFTTLDIIGFATTGCPLGINIPNYDDIRESEGFKNVFLLNSLGSYQVSNVEFATPEQGKILAENTLRCYEIHVACHELLGHGTGKLIYRDKDGSAYKFTDPYTGEQHESCYEEGETWNGRFGAISTSFEECRADTAGFFLAQLPEVYTLFGFNESEIDQMLWVNIMNQLRKGILGLPLFNAETNKWGQAHTQGAYVLSMYIYRNQKSDIVKFELNAEKDEFFIHLNQENLVKEGKELIRKFLIILQTYKSAGAIDIASKWYAKYSEVDDFFLEVRKLVLKKKK